jgi:hypothetical protein
MPKPTAFTKQAAARVAKATRAVERMGGSSGGGWHPYRGGDEEPGRVAKATKDWPPGTCQTVEVWEKGKDCVPVKTDPVEEIKDVVNLLFDIKAESWLLLIQAATGKWYVVAVGHPDTDASCRQTIGGEDLRKLGGYEATRMQILGHTDAGCLQWFDILDCSAATTPGTGP